MIRYREATNTDELFPPMPPKPTPGLGDELFPDGRHVWYEGDDPEGFVATVRERFGIDLELTEDPSGFAFFCPPGYVDAIVYGPESLDAWPIGT